MSYIEDFGLESPARAFILLTLFIKDICKKKAMDILHLQKVIRFFEFLKAKQDIDFSNYSLGGVSYEIQENIDTLLDVGLINRADHFYELTSEGEKAVMELMKILNVDDIQKMTYAKNKLNHLNSHELMFFMYVLLPETQKYSTEFAQLNKNRDKLIQSLFLKGAICTEEEFKMFGVRKEELIETIAITQDKEFMQAIKEGCEDIKKGRVRQFPELLYKYRPD
ncbi:MAG: hypothetical protein FJZ49_07100 [Candidatus Verstraetearchaeota archaeon]|nr:hypothetical protein [Candidatus Verstraetearchaeota archaeon]